MMGDIPKELIILELDYEEEAQAAIKMLLETKHLYQSVAFGEDLKKKIMAQDLPSILSKSKSANGHASEILRGYWNLIADKQPWEGADPIHMGPPPGLSHIRIALPRVKVTCGKCKTQNAPHIPFGAHEHRPNWNEFADRNSAGSQVIQVLSFKYVCQSCDLSQQSILCFMVTRKGEKLTLSGRSEMEEVFIPKCIPSEESKLLSDAIITNQASMPLAGLFYLRAFVEQYLRRKTGMSDTAIAGDELAEAYHKLLPAEFPSKFKCMKEVYRNLSGKIHTANADQKTFDESHEKLIEHFKQLDLMPIVLHSED